MSLDVLVTPFLDHELFADLEIRRVSRIALSARQATFARGETIAREGELAEAAVFVLSGTLVSVYGDAPDEPAERIEAGAMACEMAMLVETVHSATLIAASEARILFIEREAMLAMMESDPLIAEHFVDKLANRLNRIASELRQVRDAFDGDLVSMPMLGSGADHHVRASDDAPWHH